MHVAYGVGSLTGSGGILAAMGTAWGVNPRREEVWHEHEYRRAVLSS